MLLLLQVLVTSLSLENIGYLEPANFWIGPSAVSGVFSLAVVASHSEIFLIDEITSTNI